MVKIGVSGAKGRMGSRIVALAKDDAAIEVSGAFDLGEDAAAAVGGCDCLIDFTAPGATMEHLALCVERGKAIVIGTTGLSDEERAKVQEASAAIPVVFSPNMSVGVNTLLTVLPDLARRLGPDYAVEIVEAHHRAKKDAPSGTAKKLAQVVAEVTTRDIPTHAIRLGDIVGDHTVIFCGNSERIEVTHRAHTRDLFAVGAVRAAKWVAGKPAGLYTMQEVLQKC